MFRDFCRSRGFLCTFVLVASLSFARDKQENWRQVSTPHFTVVCNDNENQARHIADQFERIRLILHGTFPTIQDPAVPIIVIAVKDTKDFRALEPRDYLASGQLDLAGIFLQAEDKDYVLLRSEAGGNHPYATVYHEYTHLLLSGMNEALPLWFNEGLAEFYQNTDIYNTDTILGQVSPYDIYSLRHDHLLPLTTLLAVDRNSPYYHDEQKGSIFYSESWALIHYLETQDARDHSHKIADYARLVGDHLDGVAAATRAFGDLTQLQSALESYIQRLVFRAVRLTNLRDPGDASFKVQSITSAQADAIRADFLAYNHRENDARALLSEVLRTDPANVLAHETMGYLEFRAGHVAQAEHWFEQAVKLDSQSYLANYYFASIAMNREPNAENDKRIEDCLRKAIKLNPPYAPSYDRLALFYEKRDENLDQAHALSLQAMQLDPDNVSFRLHAAHILLTMHCENDAIALLQVTMKMAKNPSDIAEVQDELETVKQVKYLREPSR
jgi:tetratricopeptide (TPR) repeat protein